MKADIKRLLELCPKELINKNLSSSDYWDESVGDEVVRMSSPKAKSKPTKEERKLERRQRLVDQMTFSDGKYLYQGWTDMDVRVHPLVYSPY